METDDPLTYDELYADLCAADTQSLPEQFFTIKQHAKKIGMGRQAAERRLAKRLEAGELETKMALLNGRHTRIYWFRDVTE